MQSSSSLVPHVGRTCFPDDPIRILKCWFCRNPGRRAPDNSPGVTVTLQIQMRSCGRCFGGSLLGVSVHEEALTGPRSYGHKNLHCFTLNRYILCLPLTTATKVMKKVICSSMKHSLLTGLSRILPSCMCGNRGFSWTTKSGLLLKAGLKE
jgi:hypothetical protein